MSDTTTTDKGEETLTWIKKLAVVLLGCGAVGVVGFFRAVERTEVYRFVIEPYLCRPFVCPIFPWANTLEARRIGGRHFSIVLVFLRRSAAKIFYSVIQLIPVYVVERFFRPSPIHVQPCESMLLICLAVNYQNSIPLQIDVICDATRPRSGTANCVRKYPGDLVVVNERSKKLRSQGGIIGVAHLRSPETWWEVALGGFRPLVAALSIADCHG